jgi:murein DD-endopeptidase MepM/ murein hydrolase activator NlpD
MTIEQQDKSFDWPVDAARMTRGFLPNKRRPHLGIDLAAPKGTPILAAQGGTIIYAGREFKGYGKMVLIESGDGWATLYAHFDKILVSEGQKVRKGEVIGAMGRTGRATGVHLHFEIRKNRGPIDPLPLLPETTATATAQL